MPFKDRKELDRYRNQLLRKAEGIQRRLEEVTRASREELISIRDEIRTLDSLRETLEQDSERLNILDRKPATVKKDYGTVLIVEKRSNYARLLANQIASAGFTPVVAYTVEGGLKKVENCHPNLILLELELPDRDGLRFVSEIRRIRELPIPIIAMSALPHLKSRCLELGCNDFLLKPVRMIDVIRRVRKFLYLNSEASSGRL